MDENVFQELRILSIVVRPGKDIELLGTDDFSYWELRGILDRAIDKVEELEYDKPTTPD